MNEEGEISGMQPAALFDLRNSVICNTENKSHLHHQLKNIDFSTSLTGAPPFNFLEIAY